MFDRFSESHMQINTTVSSEEQILVVQIKNVAKASLVFRHFGPGGCVVDYVPGAQPGFYNRRSKMSGLSC